MAEDEVSITVCKDMAYITYNIHGPQVASVKDNTWQNKLIIPEPSS